MKRVLNKKNVFYLLLLLSGWSTEIFGQSFSEVWSLPIPGPVESAKPEWADLDNDGLLDIVLLTSEAGGQHFIVILKGDTVNTPIFDDALKFPVTSTDRFYITDFNSDNSLDIIVSGTGIPVDVYINKGDFVFELATFNIPSFSKMLFADIDNDAAPEWIVSYASLVVTFKENGAGNWTPVDTLAIKASTLEALDADGDGFRDLFLSGEVTPDSLFTGFLINLGNFKFSTSTVIEADGVGSLGDLNHDGFFEIILEGTNLAGNDIMKIYRSNGSNYQVKDTTLNAISPSFIADFNSDGIADLNYWSKTPEGDSISVIQTSPSEVVTLDLHQVVVEKFGDVEHDGDLDAVQIKKDGSLNVVLLRNTAPKNNFPDRILDANAFSFFDHIFIAWSRPNDDHTPVRALTYDVYLDGVNSGEFDLLNEKRLKVNHGNNGTSDFLLIREPETGGMQFALQAVDNAFHAGRICLGTVHGCSTMELDSVKMCTAEQKTFTSPETARWFSFSSGYLSSGTSMSVTASTPDVIFYYIPGDPDCANLKAWYIDVDDTPRVESLTLYACEDGQLQLEVEPAWTSVAWTSDLYGSLGNSHAIQYPVTAEDQVNAMLSMGTGCTVDRQFTILVSKPDVKVTADNTYVFAGKSIQLHASGAEHYVWESANGIDDINSANPTVSPIETTDFVVNGYDSIGCVDQGSIRITVERNGFIPSLFTPNSDGKNDLLRVYGVSSAAEFSLEIFNRNGSKVFSASTISESTGGWDGTTRGVKQPAGVYFWTVKGKLFSGENVQLNGKESGSIVLVR